MEFAVVRDDGAERAYSDWITAIRAARRTHAKRKVGVCVWARRGDIHELLAVYEDGAARVLAPWRMVMW